MKLLITGGTLEAEIQNNPLNVIQKQLASISRKNEFDINTLRLSIDKISELKDSRVDKLIEEFHERSRLEDMEIGELKNMIMDLSKETNTLPLNNIEGLRDKLQSVETSTKDIINRINIKIDRISKDKSERIKRVMEEVNRIGDDGKKTINSLRSQIIDINNSRERARKVLELEADGFAKKELQNKPRTIDGTKYMGKLNYKPKMPI